MSYGVFLESDAGEKPIGFDDYSRPAEASAPVLFVNKSDAEKWLVYVREYLPSGSKLAVKSVSARKKKPS